MKFISSFTTVVPIITQPPTNTTVTSGEVVNFTCTATGKPRAVISWLRNNNEVISNNSLSDGGVPVIITNSIMGNCTITDPPSQCVSSSTLQILNTRAVDSGEYTCVANNQAGNDKMMIALVVNGITYFDIISCRHVYGVSLHTCGHADPNILFPKLLL